MKYEEILELQDYFQEFYDLENEPFRYWKQFIPNDKFYKVLSETINSLESTKPEDRKSIWLQGAYGTGKSHATAVVKHLLYDDPSDIDDFIENLDGQIRFRVKNFRKVSRAFPVVLKGTAFVSDNRTLALVVEKAVKKALKDQNLYIYVEDDFDRMARLLSENIINYESISEGTKLENFGGKENVLRLVEDRNIEILKILESIMSQRGYPIPAIDIKEYLTKVVQELKNKGVAKYLIIYWDEFTGVLELPKSGLLLTELQNIAELSVSKGVYLFVVAHKRRRQTEATQQELDKVLDRFKVIDYRMESITTYHIINAAIKKKDQKKFEEVRDSYIEPLKPLIETINNNEGIHAKKFLENLFPIHPYTAYLATLIARYIGSTERSIFSFLCKEGQGGFKQFIRENPGENGKIFLTADNLWDFFYEEFERIEDERISAVVEKFKLHKDTLEEKGEQYLSVFKGLLLLNLLYRYVEIGESSLVSPSDRNILNLFLGSIDEDLLITILKFIDDNQIINKTPDNLYLITSLHLPLIEIETERDSIKKSHDTIEKILGDSHKRELRDSIVGLVNREVEFDIMDASLNEYRIRNKIEKSFSKDYAIRICLFLARDHQELLQIKNTLENVSSDDPFKNVIFIVSEVILDDATFNKYIEYKARAKVADRHNYPDERDRNEIYASKVIADWLDRVKFGYIEWFLNGENGKDLIIGFSKKINEELVQKIFSYGLDNLKKLQVSTIWKKQKSTKAAEIFIFSKDRDEVEERTKNNPWKYLREIIKDNNGEYIVDINLKIKDDITESHPIKMMHSEVLKIFEQEKSKGIFNIGDALSFLSKPPYGLYSNMINTAAISFLMRDYMGKLFEARTGIPIQKDAMRDKILYLFEYWEKGAHREKLDVRFGTEDEEELINILARLFNLNDVKGLTDARWKVREWIKNQGVPIWVFKVVEGVNENVKKAVDAIFELVQSIDDDLTYEKVLGYLSTIKPMEYELDIIIDKENPEELFEKWLQNIDGVDISPTDVREVITYVNNHMPEEVSSWTEDKVREKVKDWYISSILSRQYGVESSLSHSHGGGTQKSIGSSNAVDGDEKKDLEVIKKEIERWPVELLRKVLIELIEAYPFIVKNIEKYFIRDNQWEQK